MSREYKTEAETSDRDSRFLAMTRAKGGQIKQAAPKFSTRTKAWGGALRRMVAVSPAPSREDEARYTSVPGRYVPVGFARYVSPVVDPSLYRYYRVAKFRIAVPATLGSVRVRELLYRVYYYGPLSAGYVLIGDTLVPAILGPGDRRTVAESGIGYAAYPLSP